MIKTFQQLFEEFIATLDDEKYELYSTQQWNAEYYISLFKNWLYTQDYGLNVIYLLKNNNNKDENKTD